MAPFRCSSALLLLLAFGGALGSDSDVCTDSDTKCNGGSDSVVAPTVVSKGGFEGKQVAVPWSGQTVQDLHREVRARGLCLLLPFASACLAACLPSSQPACRPCSQAGLPACPSDCLPVQSERAALPVALG